MKILPTPPLSLNQAVTSFKCLVAMVFIAATGKSQTATTFTASDIIVTSTITAGGPISGQCITANDTLRAKDQVVAEQDLKVAGDINLAGSLFLNYNRGLKVVTPNTTTGNGPIVVLGNTAPPISGDDPAACVVSSGGWFTPGPGLGVFSSFDIGVGTNKSTLSMFIENNAGVGNGYIDIGGSLNGTTPGDLFINNKCVRNTKINLAGGTVFMGDQVRMNKFVEIGPLTGATTGFGLPLFKINISGGTAMEVVTSNNNVRSYSILNNGNSNPYTVFGDGRVQLLSAVATNKMLSIGDINATTNIEKFGVFGDGRCEILTEINKKAFRISGLNPNSTTNENFVIYADGRVQIGKSFGSPASALTVGGQIAMINGTNGNFEFLVDGSGALYCRSIKVKLGTLPDYVFEENYKLKPLNEVELYYKKHKHLEGVPSEREVVKNDLDLGEMSSILLKKVEELTLYTVELDKQLESAKKEIELLKKK
ncbi:MAG: hypothetical protein Q7W45_17770 [Bacteroidota bacterium]|nr:hypothetical protein [Bacteroidota bacterium]MDP3146234.1 hypothetical protein [Bacteroidota bacterium]MDP3558139.1 hypothetical protein [Bacteroidota bacterium]